MGHGIITRRSGLDTSDATATAATLFAGYTAYVNGKKITGTVQTQEVQTYNSGQFYYISDTFDRATATKNTADGVWANFSKAATRVTTTVRGDSSNGTTGSTNISLTPGQSASATINVGSAGYIVCTLSLSSDGKTFSFAHTPYAYSSWNSYVSTRFIMDNIIAYGLQIV